MSTATASTTATQTYVTYIGAAPAAVWEALTTSAWTERYGYAGPIDLELRPGGVYLAYAPEAMKAGGGPDVMVEGEVLDVDAPHRLVQTWKPVWDEAITAEARTRLRYELEEHAPGVTRLTLTHELDGAPITASFVAGSVPGTGGGWSYVLSDLKTLLETGAPLAG